MSDSGSNPATAVGIDGGVRAFDMPSGWSTSVKLRRVLWMLFRPLFWRGSGRFLSPLRVLALRLFGADIDGPVRIMDGVRVWHPWSLTMMPRSTLGRGVEVYNFAQITIGAQTTVSQDSFLCSATHDFEDPAMPLIYHPIVIGTGAWVAAQSFIGPGVTIGDGAVVGARAVVVSDVAPWTVVAGNPARFIKTRTRRGSAPDVAAAR